MDFSFEARKERSRKMGNAQHYRFYLSKLIRRNGESKYRFYIKSTNLFYNTTITLNLIENPGWEVKGVDSAETVWYPFGQEQKMLKLVTRYLRNEGGRIRGLPEECSEENKRRYVHENYFFICSMIYDTNEVIFYLEPDEYRYYSEDYYTTIKLNLNAEKMSELYWEISPAPFLEPSVEIVKYPLGEVETMIEYVLNCIVSVRDKIEEEDLADLNNLEEENSNG